MGYSERVREQEPGRTTSASYRQVKIRVSLYCEGYILSKMRKDRHIFIYKPEVETFEL